MFKQQRTNIPQKNPVQMTTGYIIEKNAMSMKDF
jgi:hypothetical protein